MKDNFENAFDLPINLPVREAKDSIASFSESLVAYGISLPMAVKAMLMAVNFDDDPRAPAFEVDDVWRKRRLPAEMMAKGAEFAEAKPERHLLARHGFS